MTENLWVKLLPSAPRYANYFARILKTDNDKCMYTVEIERQYRGATRKTTLDVPFEFVKHELKGAI